MAKTFEDRSPRLFGRERDIAKLTERAQHQGLTTVVARPQMGKSWLLNELGRRLSEQDKSRFLVGYAESFGETPDLLLRAVIDLYTRWLSNAAAVEQAKMAWHQKKAGIAPAVADAIEQLLSATLDGTGIVFKAIKGVISAGKPDQTGGIELPAMQYEQARDLLSAVARVSGRPLLIVLDQWEQSPEPEREARTLESFVRRAEDWPQLHVLMALRSEEPAVDMMDRIVKSHFGPAERFDLKEMDLGDDEERSRLLQYLRSNVPAATELDSDDLLREIAGYPAVIGKWTGDYWRERMASEADLHERANDAWQNRYPEIGPLLAGLHREGRRMSIRLAFVPATATAELWRDLNATLLGGLPEAVLDELYRVNLLDVREPPSFGHAKRVEFIQHWLRDNCLGECRAELDALIYRIGSTITDLGERTRHHSETLRSLAPRGAELGLAPQSRALCAAAATLFADFRFEVTDIRAAVRLEIDHEHRTAAPLLAMGLNNTLRHAKEEGDLERRDALLQDLRDLVVAYPDDAAVREQLAMGLFNTLNHAKAEDDLERRDVLLQDLRDLAAACPGDAAVREWLAKGLVNTLNHAKAEDDLESRDALFQDLRDFAAACPGDAAVREQLAKGLFNTLVDSKEEDDLERRDVLLQHLRGLAAACPEDASVREPLAVGLFNTLVDSKEENDLERRDALLQDLRDLAAACPDDAAVRGWLAMGLVSTLLDAEEEGGLERRDALAAEFRELVEAWPEEEWAQKVQAALGELGLADSSRG